VSTISGEDQVPPTWVGVIQDLVRDGSK